MKSDSKLDELDRKISCFTSGAQTVGCLNTHQVPGSLTQQDPGIYKLNFYYLVQGWGPRKLMQKAYPIP